MPLSDATGVRINTVHRHQRGDVTMTEEDAAVESSLASETLREQLERALMEGGGRRIRARELVEAAIKPENQQVAAEAYDLLGDVLADEEDWEGAEEAYQAAIDTADPQWAPIAQVDLGGLHLRRDDLEGARELLQAAIRSGNPQVVARANYLLGNVLEQQEDWEGAEEAYQAAIDTADPQLAPLAQFNLGMLRAQRGDPEGARVLLQAAIRSGNPQVAAWANDLLGGALADQEDGEGGEEAYRAAIETADPERALAEGGFTSNVIDMLILQQLRDPQGSSSDLWDAPEIAEMVELSRRAFSDDRAALAVLFALRQSVAADEAGDLQEGIRQSEAVLEHIDATYFPLTAGGAHLKIGGALAIQSESHDEVDLDGLRRAVTHLESALVLLPPQKMDWRALADYNAAMAFHTLWQRADDWDSDNDARDKALHHGLAAIDAMNHGASVGNRDSVSRVVLSILLADGEPLDAKARDQVIDVLQAWLASPEGKALPREERSGLKKLYDEIVKLRDRA
jgi:tetratricopeptide (TPR) repeat protein